MRILMLSHAERNRDAGASRFYCFLEEGLRASGHDVRVMHYEDFGVPTPRFLKLTIDRLFLPEFISRRCRPALGSGPDVILSSSGMCHPLFRSLHREHARPVLVNHQHGLATFDHQANVTEYLAGHLPLSPAYRMVTGGLPSRWDAAAARFADLSIVQNRRDLEFLFRASGRRGDVVMIPSGLDEAILAGGIDTPPPEERDPFSLLWFGSWVHRKGIAYLPAAFDAILDRFPQAQLTIGGTHCPERRIKGDFSARAAARITVLDRISVTQQVAEFGRHACFLFPSLSEGFGLALLEAMAMGLAAVTTQTGFGADFLVPREHGMIVPRASSSHLATAVCELLEHAALRHEVARRGQMLARRFTLTRMISTYEQTLEAQLRVRYPNRQKTAST